MMQFLWSLPINLTGDHGEPPRNAQDGPPVACTKVGTDLGSGRSEPSGVLALLVGDVWCLCC